MLKFWNTPKWLGKNSTSSVRSGQTPTLESLEPRILLAAVPLFSQRDPAWANDPVIDQSGVTAGTIQNLGCAMTCTAMLAKYYGTDTDPKQLNAWLNTHQGYASAVSS